MVNIAPLSFVIAVAPCNTYAQAFSPAMAVKNLGKKLGAVPKSVRVYDIDSGSDVDFENGELKLVTGRADEVKGKLHRGKFVETE